MLINLNRYDRVRWLRSRDDQVSLPLLIDKKHKHLAIYDCPEWDPVWDLYRITRDERATYSRFQNIGRPSINLGGGYPLLEDVTAPITVSNTQPLNNAFTFSVAGQCIGSRLIAAQGFNLTGYYTFVHAITGVPANVDFLLTQDIGAGANEQRRPATEITRFLVAPGGVTGWLGGTFGAVQAVPANAVRWLVVGDANGAAGDFVTVRGGNSDSSQQGGPFWQRLCNFISSNGFATNGTTPTGFLPQMVLTLQDGRSIGNPWSANTSVLKTAGLQLGAHIQNGIGFKIKCYGACFMWDTTTAYPADLRLQFWNGNDGPSGSPLDNSTVKVRGSGAAANNCPMFYVSGTSLDIMRSQEFRVVLISSTASIRIWRYDIGSIGGAGNIVDIQKAMNGGGALTGGGLGGWVFTENTAGAWVDTNTSAPAMQLLVEDFLGGGGTYIPTFRRRRR